ncbi:MAG TPA: acetylxylan esterase [Bryobacteraceae bacterium]|nr:acetylxylan esterase [Bryobacteraceae bacterium]
MKSLLAILVAASLYGQAPAEDRRNTYTPNTDSHFAMPEYKTLEQWEARKKQLRLQVLAAAGLLPMPDKTPLNPQVFGKITQSDYTIEKVLIETLPGYWLGGNLYRPVTNRRGLPAVATPHGHWVYGRLEHTHEGSIPARCINLARQGYVVFAWDMVGWNDTVQTPHPFGATPEEQLWSFGPLQLQLWNSIRAIDFLQSLPEVDPKRIAMTGASGGGTQTFLAYAVDDRIQWAAPVNMISGIMQGGSPCENAPSLRVDANNIEIGAMMAPRPLLMVSATGDWTRNTPKEEFPALRHIYELYGKPENVETIQIDAEHNYNQQSREAVYRFFGKHVLGNTDAAAFSERAIRLERLQDMLALHGRTLPPGALDFDGVFKLWKSIAQRKFEQTTDLNVLRERLRVVLAVEWPQEVAHQSEGDRRILTRPGKGDRVAAVRIAGSGRPVLLVHPDGAAAALKSPDAASVTGRPGFAIDAFQTGAAVAPRDRSHKFFLTFNRSDDANRVQDILTALKFMNSPDTELVCSGKAAVWCAAAAAVAPMPLKLKTPPASFAGSDADFTRDLFVPGIQRIGGGAALRRLLAGSR